MAELTNAKHLRGTGVLTFNNIELSGAANFTLKFDPVIDQSPDVEGARDPLGFVVKRRGVSVECDNYDITADMVRMLSGYNNSTDVGTNVDRIDFDETKTDLMEGELALVGALIDGSVVTAYFKRAVAVPPGQSIIISGKETGGTKLTFVKCQPTDGSTISGYIQIGAPAS